MKARTRETLKIYWSHSRRYPVAIFLIAFGLFGLTLGELYTPFWYKAMFDGLAKGPGASPDQIIGIVAMIAVVGLGTWIFRRVSEFATSFFEARVISDLLNTCFSYLQEHSYGFFLNKFTGSLVRKVNRYARAFEEIADEFIFRIGPTVLRIIGILIILLFRAWFLSLVLLVWTIIFILYNLWFYRYKLPYDIRRAATDTKVTGFMADALTNNVNLKLFNGTKYESRQHRKLTDELYQIRMKSWTLNTISDSGQSFLLIVLEFGILFAAVKYWQKGVLTVGDFALIQAYLIQIFYRVWDIGRFMRRIYENLADANEMTEILLTPHEVADKPAPIIITVQRGLIEFKDVSFQYVAGASIFKRFNLSILPGERVALIGPSGGGKSTVVKLLFRFFDLQGGKILIDGQNIAEATQESLRSSLALVPQEPILFHRSLMENIRYARKEATKEEVFQAAKLAHAHEFIKTFPQGYDTFVGERGVKLSGGERQRVAIARAILKNAPILVLDEATSSLDSESEYFIQDALKSLMAGKTTIVIAHRLSTIMQMDRIVVLENGRVIEQGRHKELLKVKKGIYQKLWNIQAGGFATHKRA